MLRAAVSKGEMPALRNEFGAINGSPFHLMLAPKIALRQDIRVACTCFMNTVKSSVYDIYYCP